MTLTSALKGPAIFAALMAAAEAAWRFAGHRWPPLNRLGTQAVALLHPDIAAAPEAAEIALGYSHALWLLAAVALASMVLMTARSALKATVWAPSPWVALLPAAAVAATVVAFLLRSNETGPTPEQRTLQAEHEQSTGTGAASYDRVLKLVDQCHTAIRKELASQPGLVIDGGLVSKLSYIYTYVLPDRPGLRFVRMAATELEVKQGSIGAIAGPLWPPIEGGYQIEGLLTYGASAAVEQRSLREYRCALLVTGDRYEVRDLKIKPVR